MANKKNTSYAFLGIMLIASSCAQEEALNRSNRQPGGRIEFKASMPEISTRASEMTEGSLKEFQASAFTMGASTETPYFVGKTFSLNSATGKYFNSECIWPNSNDTLRFVAFAPSGAAVSSPDDPANLSGFKVDQDIARQFDFVTAIASGSLDEKDETEGIELTFQHQLSRIFVKAYGESESFDLEIAGVRIGGIGTGGTFTLSAPEGAEGPAKGGSWESVTKGFVEYVYGSGDKTVTVGKTTDSSGSSDEAVSDSSNSSNKPVSIMGAKIGGADGYDNSAMIVPSDNKKWNHRENKTNGTNHADGMYISVLLRVTDVTAYATDDNLVYPYHDYAKDPNTVYLAVDKADGKIVKTRVYRQGDAYFTDAACTQGYDVDDNTEVRPYGWAALPVEDEFQPGRMYTYTLNYTYGVGLRDPQDSNPGDPIISDRVLVNVTVAPWEAGTNKEEYVPRR